MIRVSAILLAAGESKRMGMNKLMLPWGKETVLEHCLDVLLRSQITEVIVVLSQRTNTLRSHLRGTRVKVVMNHHYKRGMSTSIRTGLRALGQKSQGILIALGDQPLLRTSTVNALIRAFGRGKKRIVLPTFKGRRGHPVLFDRRYERELLRLRKDVGARFLLQKHSESVLEVRTKSEGVLLDMDTWKDYQKRLRL